MTFLKKIIVTCCGVISALTIILLIYIHRVTEDIDCIGNLNIVAAKNKLSVLIIKKMHDGIGFVSLRGNFYAENKLIGSIDRSIQFSYKKNANWYVMHSLLVKKSVNDNVDDHYLQQILPAFYLRKDEEQTIFTKNIGLSGLLLYTNPVPFGFCARVRK